MDQDGFLAGPASPTLPLVEVLPVRVLSRLFQGLVLKGLKQAHADDGRLQFFDDHQALADKAAFDAYLESLYKIELRFLPRSRSPVPTRCSLTSPATTHWVAISNHRLISVDEKTVIFTWKDCRAEGSERYKTMALDIHEFIRRFLIRVFPEHSHRIRHYGLLANGDRADDVALARRLLAAQDDRPAPAHSTETEKAVDQQKTVELACPACGGRLFEELTPLAATVPSHSSKPSNLAPNRRPITSVPCPSIGSRRHEHRDKITPPY